MSETPKWRCGMTLCNACGLLAAKRSKSDAKGFVEDADAESQDTAAMQAARTAACASALAALSAARAIAPPRAAFGTSSEAKTVRPPIKPAVQRAVQSEPLCARGVAQPAAMPSTNSVGTRACVKLALRITCGRARVICGTPTRALAAQQNRDKRVSLVDGVGDDAGF